MRFVTSEEEITRALAGATDPPERLLVPGREINSQLLIEEAVEGPEFSVEMLVRGGAPCFANVTGKHLLPGPYPVEIGHEVPTTASPDIADQLVADTARLASAAGFGDGILHCEWIVGGDGPVFVECAARMAGDEIPTLISLAYGFPLAQAYLRVLLGDDPGPLPAAPPAGAAVRFLTAAPGVVQDITGVAEARQSPGVHAVHLSVKAGEAVAPVTSSWDRVGYVLARAGTAAEADSRAREGAGRISVQTWAAR